MANWRLRNEAKRLWHFFMTEGLLLRAHSPVFPKAAPNANLCSQPDTEQTCTSLPPPLQRRLFTCDGCAWCAARAAASLRRPDAAQIRHNVALLLLDGLFEGSFAIPATQRVGFETVTARAAVRGGKFFAASRGPRRHVSPALDEKTRSCKLSIPRRAHQRSLTTDNRD